MHIACALLLFGIVRRTLAGPKLAPQFGATANVTALGASMLWMVHPLQSEAVDYVTQRTESHDGAVFPRYACIAPSGLGGRRRTPASWQVLAVVACALGMASKESMVTAPLIVALYDRTFEFNSWREALQTRKYFYSALAATWIELGAFLLQQPRTTAGFSVAVSPMDIPAQPSRDDCALSAVELVAEPSGSRLRSPAPSIAWKCRGDRDRRRCAPGCHGCRARALAGDRLSGSDVLRHAGANVERDSDRE